MKLLHNFSGRWLTYMTTLARKTLNNRCSRNTKLIIDQQYTGTPSMSVHRKKWPTRYSSYPTFSKKSVDFSTEQCYRYKLHSGLNVVQIPTFRCKKKPVRNKKPFPHKQKQHFRNPVLQKFLLHDDGLVSFTRFLFSISVMFRQIFWCYQGTWQPLKSQVKS